MQKPIGMNINNGYSKAPMNPYSGLRFLSSICKKETMNVKTVSVTWEDLPESEGNKDLRTKLER